MGYFDEKFAKLSGMQSEIDKLKEGISAEVGNMIGIDVTYGGRYGSVGMVDWDNQRVNVYLEDSEGNSTDEWWTFAEVIDKLSVE